jgi:hypothetical protein
MHGRTQIAQRQSNDTNINTSVNELLNNEYRL